MSKYRLKPHQFPSWSINLGSYPELSNEPSRWEKFLEAENLDEKDVKKNNPKVREFVVKHYRSYFVPMKVLKMYGMEYE